MFIFLSGFHLVGRVDLLIGPGKSSGRERVDLEGTTISLVKLRAQLAPSESWEMSMRMMLHRRKCMTVVVVLVGQDDNMQEVVCWVVGGRALEMHTCCEYLVYHAVLIGLELLCVWGKQVEEEF